MSENDNTPTPGTGRAKAPTVPPPLAMQGIIDNSVVPICSRPDDVSLEGSGVFVRLGGHAFIFTAVHVSDVMIGPHFFIKAGEAFVPSTNDFGGSMPKGENREKDNLDFAYTILNRATYKALRKHFAVLTVGAFEFNDLTNPGNFYCCVGYPAALNAAGATPSKRAARLIWAGPRLTDIELARKCLEAKSHIGVHYLIKDFDNSSAESKTTFRSPLPHGMSGGPVWRIRENCTAGRVATLVGILTDYRTASPTALAAVRIEAVIASVMECYPYLRDLLPLFQDLNIRTRLYKPGMESGVDDPDGIDPLTTL